VVVKALVFYGGPSPANVPGEAPQVAEQTVQNNSLAAEIALPLTVRAEASGYVWHFKSYALQQR